MTIRFKTFTEFNKRLLIVNRSDGGVNLVCRNPPLVVQSCVARPWNTPDMKKTFLVRLYIHEVLIRGGKLPHIKVAPGFEWLGKRCTYNEQEHVIIDAVEAAHKETGEMIMLFKIYPVSRYWGCKNHPFTVTEKEVEL